MPGKYIFFIVSLASFFIDRLSKFFIEENLHIGEVLMLPGEIISITKIYNTGAAFGIMQDKTAFLLVFAALVILSLSFYLIKNDHKLTLMQKIGFGLILGGTAGNLFDRAVYGCVIDFIKPEFITFPVFNIADMCINIGVMLVIIKLFSNKPDKA